jgi:hypothetical protein
MGSPPVCEFFFTGIWSRERNPLTGSPAAIYPITYSHDVSMGVMQLSLAPFALVFESAKHFREPYNCLENYEERLKSTITPWYVRRHEPWHLTPKGSGTQEVL